MSIIPEIIIHNVIVKGLREIRKDPRVLDVIFKNLDQQTLEAMKNTILKQSINFTINYPRADALKLPTISLLLKNEREDQVFLNDMMGAAPHYGMPDQEHTIDTLGGHAASVSDLQGLPTKVAGGISPERLEIDEANNITTVFWSAEQATQLAEILSTFAELPCFDVYVVSGMGSGQKFMILRIDSNSLDIEGTFDPQLDSSSVLDIRLSKDTGLAIGEPSRVYPAGATNLYRKGANFDVQYQLSVLAGHQDEVLYLYSVLKALLFSQKMFMESQGMFALKISGSDFAPRTEFLPGETFQRIMNIQFTYPFTYLEETEAAKEIQIRLQPSDPATGEPCDTIETILIEFGSETTI